MQQNTLTAIRESAESADLIIYVADVTDFPSTFSRRVVANYAHKMVLVLNKFDLLPSKVSETQVVNWVHKYLDQIDISVRDVQVISAKSRVGISDLWKWVVKELHGKGTVALIGATGVGKTALFKLLNDTSKQTTAKKGRLRRTSSNMLIDDESDGKDKVQAVAVSRRRTRRPTRKKKTTPDNAPTAAEQAVSSPTTNSKRSVSHRRRSKKVNPTTKVNSPEPKSKIKLVDTPDLTVKDSLCNVVCSVCSQKIASTKRLRSRLIRLKPGQSITLGEFAAVTLVSSSAESAAVGIRLYISSAVAARRITESKFQALMTQEDGLMLIKCQKCNERWPDLGWEEVEIALPIDQEVAIHGMGWLQALQRQVVIRIILPAGVAASIRPRLIQ